MALARLVLVVAIMMPAGRVWGPRRGPAGPAKTACVFTWDGNQTWAIGRWEHSLLKIEQIQMDWVFQRLRKKGGSLIFVRSLGAFIDNCSLMHMSSQASRNWSEQGQGPGVHHKSLIPWSRGPWYWDVHCWWSGNVYNFIWSLSPGPSSDVIYSREIINPLSFTRRTYSICVLRHV